MHRRERVRAGPTSTAAVPGGRRGLHQHADRAAQPDGQGQLPARRRAGLRATADTARNNTGVGATEVTRPRARPEGDRRSSPEPQVFSGEKTTITYTVTNDSDARRLAADRVLDRPDLLLEGSDVHPECRADPARRRVQIAEHRAGSAAGELHARGRGRRCRRGIEGTLLRVRLRQRRGSASRRTAAGWPVAGGRQRLLRRRVVTAHSEPTSSHQQHRAGAAARSSTASRTCVSPTSPCPTRSPRARRSTSASRSPTSATRDTREQRLVRSHLPLARPVARRRRLPAARTMSPSRPRRRPCAPARPTRPRCQVTIPFELERRRIYLLAFADANVGRVELPAEQRLSPRLQGRGRGQRHRRASCASSRARATTSRQRADRGPPYAAARPAGDHAHADPERATRGQEFDVSLHASPTSAATRRRSRPRWDDLIYLSRDPFLDLARRPVHRRASATRAGSPRARRYTIERTFAVPTDLATEAYYVFVVTDPARYGRTGDVFEGSTSATTTAPARADGHRAAAAAGPRGHRRRRARRTRARASRSTLEWTVTNQSDVAAAGSWTDSLFLSRGRDLGHRRPARSAAQSFSGTLLPDRHATR